MTHMFNYIKNNSKHLSIIGGYVISINEYDVCYAYKLHTDDTLTCISYCKMQDSFYNEYGGINLNRVYDFLVK